MSPAEIDRILDRLDAKFTEWAMYGQMPSRDEFAVVLREAIEAEESVECLAGL